MSDNGSPEKTVHRLADEAIHGFSAIDTEGNRVDPAKIVPTDEVEAFTLDELEERD